MDLNWDLVPVTATWIRSTETSPCKSNKKKRKKTKKIIKQIT